MIEKQSIDLVQVLSEHEPAWCMECGFAAPTPCLPYRLAALALDLQGKVARVEAMCDDA